MNIYLVPYTWARHVAVAFPSGLAATLVWWLFLNWTVGVGPFLFSYGVWYDQMFEGSILLGLVAGAIAFVNLLAEGSYRRRPLHWRLGLAGVAGLLGFVLVALLTLAVAYLLPLVVSLIGGVEHYGALWGDASTTGLRYRILEWLIAGSTCGVVVWLARLFWLIIERFGFASISSKNSVKSTFSIQNLQAVMAARPAVSYHFIGGFASAALGAGLWHLFSYSLFGDYYLASLIGFFTWGFLFGLLAWGIPDELYAGWIRVLSNHRNGLRIPIDNLDGTTSERFVGHYPRGLDMLLPAEHGIAELHVSVLTDGAGSYSVRGLSQVKTTLKRPLETLDLTYDARYPAPSEAGLKMEDRIILGDKTAGRTELEFLMLPKEER